MFGSTLALAMGLMLFGVARFSGNPAAFGAVVFFGIWFVAIGCALHIGATVNELRFLPWPVRAVAIAVAWVAIGAFTVWLLGSAPSTELLLALVATPAAIGIVRLLVSRNRRGWPVAFLVEAVALIAILGPVLLPRVLN